MSSKVSRKTVNVTRSKPPADPTDGYGGAYYKTRRGRSVPRPLSTRRSMHLVLRSSLARGDWSFTRPQNRRKITSLLQKFASKNRVKLHSFAVVGNHLHIHMSLANQFKYNSFIRALTSSIAMAATGVSRWNLKAQTALKNRRFWDCRPFTRIVKNARAFFTMLDYINLNKLEGFGFQRPQARFFLGWSKLKADST